MQHSTHSASAASSSSVTLTVSQAEFLRKKKEESIREEGNKPLVQVIPSPPNDPELEHRRKVRIEKERIKAETRHLKADRRRQQRRERGMATRLRANMFSVAETFSDLSSTEGMSDAGSTLQFEELLNEADEESINASDVSDSTHQLPGSDMFRLTSVLPDAEEPEEVGKFHVETPPETGHLIVSGVEEAVFEETVFEEDKSTVPEEEKTALESGLLLKEEHAVPGVEELDSEDDFDVNLIPQTGKSMINEEYTVVDQIDADIAKLCEELESMEVARVPLEQLFVDRDSLDQFKLAELLDHFFTWYQPTRADLYPGSIIIATRDASGRFQIVDGMHRVAVLQNLANDREESSTVKQLLADLELKGIDIKHVNVRVKADLNMRAAYWKLLPLVTSHQAALSGGLGVIDVISIVRSVYHRFVTKRPKKYRKNNPQNMRAPGEVIIDSVFTRLGIPAGITASVFDGTRSAILLRDEVFLFFKQIIRDLQVGASVFFADNDVATPAFVYIGSDDSPLNKGSRASVEFWNRIPQFIHSWSSCLALWENMLEYVFSRNSESLYRHLQEAFLLEKLRLLTFGNTHMRAKYLHSVRRRKTAVLPSQFFIESTKASKESTMLEILETVMDQVAVEQSRRQKHPQKTPSSKRSRIPSLNSSSEAGTSSYAPNTSSQPIVAGSSIKAAQPECAEKCDKESASSEQRQLNPRPKKLRIDNKSGSEKRSTPKADTPETTIVSEITTPEVRDHNRSCAQEPEEDPSEFYPDSILKAATLFFDYTHGNRNFDALDMLDDLYSRSRVICHSLNLLHSETTLICWINPEIAVDDTLKGFFQRYVSCTVYEEKNGSETTSTDTHQMQHHMWVIIAIPFLHLSSLGINGQPSGSCGPNSVNQKIASLINFTSSRDLWKRSTFRFLERAINSDQLVYADDGSVNRLQTFGVRTDNIHSIERIAKDLNAEGLLE